MARLISNWRITFEGHTLLDFGAQIEGEPEFPLTAQGQRSLGPARAWARSYGRRNRQRSYSWSYIQEYPTAAERQAYHLKQPELFPVGESGELTVEILDGPTFTARFTLLGCVPSAVANNPRRVRFQFEGDGEQLALTDGTGLRGLSWEAVNTNWEDLDFFWQEPWI